MIQQQSVTRYPLAMTHPGYKPSERQQGSLGGAVGTFGTADRYPPITVNNADQEERHRVMGYLPVGEAPKPYAAYAEYPVMVQHPDHQDAIPPEKIGVRNSETNAVDWSIIPGKPEAHPHRIVNTPEEEAEWTAKGYRRPGGFDAAAIQAAKSSPHIPGHVVEEYPKMVDGKIVDNRPIDPSIIKYPMWLAAAGKVVNNEAEELAELRKLAALQPVSAVVSTVLDAIEGATDEKPKAKRVGKPKATGTETAKEKRERLKRQLLERQSADQHDAA